MFAQAAERGRRHRAAQPPDGAGLGVPGTPMLGGISPGISPSVGASRAPNPGCPGLEPRRAGRLRTGPSTGGEGY